MSTTGNTTAIIYSAAAPNEEQKRGFLDFLKQKYGEDFALEWRKSDDFDGFKLEVGAEVYDWSTDGRLAQFREKVAELKNGGENIITLMREAVGAWSPEIISEEVGTVLTVGDGIATVSGLKKAAYGEILVFSSGIRGMVQELRDDEIGCILFGSDEDISEGDTVKRTGRTAGVPVGEELLGRVVNALGEPIDGQGKADCRAFFPIERPAPSIIDRQPVCKPMETGVLAIDAMFPIGRGQRELIIGDRQTGKTAIATDTILNQKGKDVICIYVAIGQKASSVAQLVQNLKTRGAMDYTVVVNASASESAPMQYIAPYSGCAIGEYFMQKGKDVLIVYDDLSRHAIAYRSLSLLLERAPGREAYPGDVFYLHSRLLERSAHLSDEKGGGSMTALPIVETQSGDVSAYIPTNIISITDGQIFLESDLFFAGQRPAVNVGLSVSRVGGDAQTKAMKKAAGTIRPDLAQYREMEVFTQFAGDLDETTAAALVYGQGLMRVLRQRQYSPYTLSEQVVILVTVLGKLLQKVPINDISATIAGLLEYFKEKHNDLLVQIRASGELDNELKEKITAAASEYLRGR